MGSRKFSPVELKFSSQRLAKLHLLLLEVSPEALLPQHSPSPGSLLLSCALHASRGSFPMAPYSTEMPQLWSGLCLSFFPTYFPPPDTFKILFGMVLSFGFVWFFFQLSSHNYVLARMFSLSLFNRTTFACSWYCMSCFSAAVTNALKAACGRVDFGLQLQRHSIMAGKVCPQREEAGWSFFNHTQEGENRKWSHLKALKAPLQWHAFSIKAGTPKEFINSPKLHHEPGTKCSKSWASK